MSEHRTTEPIATGSCDAWTLGRIRLVTFKTERLLTEAQRELGAFGEPLTNTKAGPAFLRVSEHVSEALEVLDELKQELRGMPSG